MSSFQLCLKKLEEGKESSFYTEEAGPLCFLDYNIIAYLY